MVLLGHLHTHEFAVGGTTDQVGNPWALERSAGGSSGGSAAALAARMVPAATGTDTAGSLRIPSALSGTSTIKPTRGLVSLRGVVPAGHEPRPRGPDGAHARGLRAAPGRAGGARPRPSRQRARGAAARDAAARRARAPSRSPACAWRSRRATAPPRRRRRRRPRRRDRAVHARSGPSCVAPPPPGVRAGDRRRLPRRPLRRAARLPPPLRRPARAATARRCANGSSGPRRAPSRPSVTSRRRRAGARRPRRSRGGSRPPHPALIEPTVPCVAPLRGDGYDHAGSDYALISLTHTGTGRASRSSALPAGVGSRSGLPVGVSLIGRAGERLASAGHRHPAAGRARRPRARLIGRHLTISPERGTSGRACGGDTFHTTEGGRPMRWTPNHEDAAPESAAPGATTARREPARAGTLTSDRARSGPRPHQRRVAPRHGRAPGSASRRSSSCCARAASRSPWRHSSAGSARAESASRRRSTWPPSTTCRSTSWRAAAPGSSRFLGTAGAHAGRRLSCGRAQRRPTGGRAAFSPRMRPCCSPTSSPPPPPSPPRARGSPRSPRSPTACAAPSRARSRSPSATSRASCASAAPASAGRRCAICPPPAGAPGSRSPRSTAPSRRSRRPSGAGSAAVRREAIAALFARATAEEQRFLAHARRRRAAPGRAGRHRHRRGGRGGRGRRRRRAPGGDARRRPAGRRRGRARPRAPRGLGAFHLQVGRPVQPMLAKTAPSLEAALAKTGEAAIEWKLDGVRIQVHRDGDDVGDLHAHARRRSASGCPRSPRPCARCRCAR